MIDRAVLLAAGRGTRLGPLTVHCPKSLLQVGGQPILVRILSGMVAEGIRDVLIVTGYRGDLIEREIGDGSTLGLGVRYARQERLEGTARALALAREFTGVSAFFYSWGDILVEPHNYGRVLDAAQGAEAVLAVNAVDDPVAGAAVYLDENRRVLRIVEKPPRRTSSTPWNNAGFGILRQSIWPLIEALTPSPRGEYELPAALMNLLAAGAMITAAPVEGPWFDIGLPEELERARAYFDYGRAEHFTA